MWQLARIAPYLLWTCQATIEREVARVNPFDWKTEFGKVINGGGFDVVIGNPPWLMVGYYVDAEVEEYLEQDRYVSAFGKFDMYYVFI